MREVPIPSHITILFVEQEVSSISSILQKISTDIRTKIIGDDTLAIDSVLKADVWRDTLLREEATLNAKLQGLEAENDEKRFDDAREEAQTRLAEVHARLAEMEAESGPARAAALLAGKLLLSFIDR
jgi:ATP-binding cassette, subfamily F, member 3